LTAVNYEAENTTPEVTHHNDVTPKPSTNTHTETSEANYNPSKENNKEDHKATNSSTTAGVNLFGDNSTSEIASQDVPNSTSIAAVHHSSRQIVNMEHNKKKNNQESKATNEMTTASLGILKHFYFKSKFRYHL
jgi:hypothetical protein